jgi:pilus assembly protein CpaC
MPAAPATAVHPRDSANDLLVLVGKSVLIDCANPVERVAVGLGDFAEAIAVSRSEILVNGKTAGDTSLIIWETGGARQFFNVKIRLGANETNDRLEGIRREFASELPGQPLKVSFENGVIFLSGTAKDLNSSIRAVEIASASGKVVNLLNVEVPRAEPQILLKVIFASVDRSLSNQLGMNLFSSGLGNTLAGVSTGQFSPPSVSLPSLTTPASAILSNELNLFAFFPGLNLGATIQALESKGLVQVLSEPNVLAENGKQASFLAGGEYPYPVVQGSTGSVTGSSVTIQFKEYGIRLNFIPTITPRGTIRLQVAPEVSSLDFTNAVEVSGFEIPAIDVRKVNTEVELGEGQSFAIGGLLDNRETETFQKIPFLSSIPILGKFFQSISKTKTNSELIVIVTPEIVAPIRAGDPLPRLKYPEKFLPPNSGFPMNTPDAKPADSAPVQQPATIPLERLIESMQPEKPLVIDSTPPGASGASASGSGTNSSPGSSQ